MLVKSTIDFSRTRATRSSRSSCYCVADWRSPARLRSSLFTSNRTLVKRTYPKHERMICTRAFVGSPSSGAREIPGFPTRRIASTSPVQPLYFRLSRLRPFFFFFFLPAFAISFFPFASPCISGPTSRKVHTRVHVRTRARVRPNCEEQFRARYFDQIYVRFRAFPVQFERLRRSLRLYGD